MLLLAALLLGNAGPSPSFQQVRAEDAIAYFKRVCVDTMPSPYAFSSVLNAEPPGWTEFRKEHRGILQLGHFWRSGRGELSYANIPKAAFGETNPACHYTFRTAPDYSHAQAAGALVGLLRLDRGRETGNRKAPQTRWEGRLPNGVRIRLFLSSAVKDLGEPAATLSVSAYQDARRGG